MEISDLTTAIRKSWGKDTCYPPSSSEWSEINPALGQCAVTALVIQDYFGGELLHCKHSNHYWNRLHDGLELDITVGQFSSDTQVCIDEISTRDHVLESQVAVRALTPQRYLTLKNRVKLLVKQS